MRYPQLKDWKWKLCWTAGVAVLCWAAAVTVGAAPQAASRPTPEWLAWSVFHNALAATAAGPQGSSKAAQRLQLSPAEMAQLIQAGHPYTEAIRAIDVETRKEVRQRYAPPTANQPVRSNRPPAQSPKTPLERAMADGFYAQVETRKAAALENHLKRLRAQLSPNKVDRISGYVRSEVAPKIELVDAALPKPKPANPGGNPGAGR